MQTTEEAEALVVRVDAGTSDTKVRRFRSGNPVATMTIGSQGAWKVEAAGVASVHAYLRFDGRQLLVATSDPRRPVVIDGHAAPETWSPLHPPCLLSLGQASLAVERSSVAPTPPNHVVAAPFRIVDAEDEPTCRKSSPMLAPEGQITPAEDELGEADLPPAEPTRLQFGTLEQSAQGTRAVQVSSLPPTLLDGPSAGEGELGAHDSVPPPPLDEHTLQLRRALRIAGAVLGLAVVVGGVYRLASRRPSSGRDARSSPDAPDVHAAAPQVAAPAMPPTGVAPGSPPIAAPPLAVPTIAAPPIFVPASEPAPAGATTGTRGQTTTERRAADAFAAGDFATALRLYRELAAARPDQPAFRQAVKILEEK